jgi:hypothetical protein
MSRLREIERVQHRFRGLVPAVERIEHGDPVRVGGHRLSVQGKRFGAQFSGGRGNGGISICPVVAFDA